MRDKVVINDLSALYVCPSADWGTIERRVIQDASYLRGVGGNAVILCLKSSLLTKAAKAHDLKIITIDEQDLSLWNFSFYFFLKNLIQEHNFDVVHCYNFEYAPMVCLVMGRFKKIPFFVTINKPIEQYYKNIFHKYLFKRIDAIITLDSFSKDLISSFLPLAQKRLHSFGMGLELIPSSENTVKTRDSLRIGCYVPQTILDKTYFNPLFHAIRILLSENRQEINFENVEVFLFSDINWQVASINNDLRWLIKDVGLEDYVRLDNSIKLLGHKPEVDMMLGLECSELIYDYEIWSLIHQIPILVPRSSAREHLLSQNSFMGETYKTQDARELKNKLFKMLTRIGKYKTQLSEMSLILQDEHSLERYSENIFSLYEKLKVQRSRLFS